MLENHSSASIVPTDDRVVSLNETARTAGISIATLRRRIADGSGPRLVRVTERRVGVRVRDLRAWLDAHTSAEQTATGQV
jgi:predicted DNA-binding transcriptional regulator AlpA